jgi:hypothetical protein
MKWKLFFAYTWPFFAIPLAVILFLSVVSALSNLLCNQPALVSLGSVVLMFATLYVLKTIKDWASFTIRVNRLSKKLRGLPNPLRRRDLRS